MSENVKLNSLDIEIIKTELVLLEGGAAEDARTFCGSYLSPQAEAQLDARAVRRETLLHLLECQGIAHTSARIVWAPRRS